MTHLSVLVFRLSLTHRSRFVWSTTNAVSSLWPLAYEKKQWHMRIIRWWCVWWQVWVFILNSDCNFASIHRPHSAWPIDVLARHVNFLEFCFSIREFLFPGLDENSMTNLNHQGVCALIHAEKMTLATTSAVWMSQAWHRRRLLAGMPLMCRHQRCADPEILNPRQSTDFDQGSASTTGEILDWLSVCIRTE